MSSGLVVQQANRADRVPKKPRSSTISGFLDALTERVNAMVLKVNEITGVVISTASLISGPSCSGEGSVESDESRPLLVSMLELERSIDCLAVEADRL